MRLINVYTLELEDFTLKEKPPYAILSHTWEDDEVTYQDMLNGKAQSKEGYTKIVQTCLFAEQADLAYAWVDTCCIDKTSSAELGEAINSMYAWYANSQVCYAFLADLDSTGNQQVTFQCRWWSRGWTLQELIAPKAVEFYDKRWRRCGTRDTHVEAISAFTNIPERVLQGSSSLSETCVAARMSWASTRHTTRVEDAAYSLLGIFGISMPLIYGEGKNAFRRLVEAIMDRSEDLSILLFKGIAILPDEPHAYKGRHGTEWPILSDVTFTRTKNGLQLTGKNLLWLSPPSNGIRFYYLGNSAYVDRTIHLLKLVCLGPQIFARAEDSILQIGSSTLYGKGGWQCLDYTSFEIRSNNEYNTNYSYRYAITIALAKSPSINIRSTIPIEAWQWTKSHFWMETTLVYSGIDQVFALHVLIEPQWDVILYLDIRKNKRPQVFLHDVHSTDSQVHEEPTMGSIFMYLKQKSQDYTLRWIEVQTMFPEICKGRPKMHELIRRGRILTASLKKNDKYASSAWKIPSFDLHVSDRCDGSLVNNQAMDCT